MAILLKAEGDVAAQIEKISEALVPLYATPNATRTRGLSAAELRKFDMVVGSAHGIVSGRPVLFRGPAGIAKTSLLAATMKANNLRHVYLNGALMNAEDFGAPMPERDENGVQSLNWNLMRHFKPGEPFGIFIDEFSRCQRQALNLTMELFSEGSLAGQDLRKHGLVALFAAMNPDGDEFGSMSRLDLAQATRFTWVDLDYNSTPWREYLNIKFADTNLSKFHEKWNALDPAMRKRFNPRIQEAFLYNVVTRRNPAKWALPILNGVQVTLSDASGTDRTDDILANFCDALGVPYIADVPEAFDRAVACSAEDGVNVYIQGAPGTGKSARGKWLLSEKHKLGYEYFSGPTMVPEDVGVGLPNGQGELVMTPLKRFTRSDRYVLIIDELNRAKRRAKNAFMEPIQERTFHGQDMGGLTSTLAFGNGAEYYGYKMDVGQNDLAQASRFAVNVVLKQSDIPALGFLLTKYGSKAEPFIEWWQDDLDDLGRFLVPPRTVEILIETHLSGAPLKWALPIVDGDRVKVPLVDLERRLADQPLARLRAIVADVDSWVAKLQDPDNVNDHLVVFAAFSKSTVEQMNEHRDAVVKLIAAPLAQHHRTALIHRQAGDRQKFWTGIFKDAFPDKLANASKVTKSAT
jgi:MoxR-like ATPase